MDRLSGATAPHKLQIKQSGISLCLRTGPTGHFIIDKNWRQFVFYNSKSSKKSNIASKNEENTRIFMTFLN